MYSSLLPKTVYAGTHFIFWGGGGCQLVEGRDKLEVFGCKVSSKIYGLGKIKKVNGE
jgi:hypothetical protein